MRSALVKNGFRYPAALLPFGWLRMACDLKLLVPFYHVVSDENPAHIRHLYPVRTTRQFREDLDFLGKNYRPVTLHEVVHHVREGIPFQKWSVHLTVDDGLRECHDVMAPLLLEKGMPATFFLNSGFLDNRALMFRYQASLLADAFAQNGFPSGMAAFDPLAVGYAERARLSDAAQAIGLDFGLFLAKKKPYLESHQVQTLLEKGFTIGGHSIDHPRYSRLPFEEQLRQTLDCQDFLEKKFKLPYRVFAFPFTDDGITRPFLERLHGTHGFALTFGGAGLKRDVVPYNLQRQPMEETGRSARKVLGAAYAYWAAKFFLGKNQLVR